MRSYVISDNELLTSRVREILLRAGHDCPDSHVMPLAAAAEFLPAQGPELLVVVLSPNPERGLAMLGELHARARASVIVVGPTNDAQLVLRALRACGNDLRSFSYVGDSDDLDFEVSLQQALERLRNQAPVEEGERGQLFAVLAPSGGSGSSTLAVNLATAFAKEAKRAALIDLKLETGDLASLLDLKPTHTLPDLCVNVDRLDPAMFERSLSVHSCGVHLLAAPRTFKDASFVRPEAVRQVLKVARRQFAYVVADLDHTCAEEQALALQLADVVLLVLRLDFTCLKNAQRYLDYFSQLGISPERVRVVVNRYGQAKEVPAAKAEAALGVKLFAYIPDDPKTVNRANNSGVPVVLESPSARVAKSMTRLAASINGRIRAK